MTFNSEVYRSSAPECNLRFIRSNQSRKSVLVKKKNLPCSPFKRRVSFYFLSLTEHSTAMMSWSSVIFTISSGISTSMGIFSSSGIFSADELRLDSFSSSSSIPEMRSATQWAVSRASGSWSQHSMMVAHMPATPCQRRKILIFFF